MTLSFTQIGWIFCGKEWWLVIFGRNLGYRKHFQLPVFKYLWSSLPTSHATWCSPQGSRSLSVSSSQPIPFTACPWALCMRTIRRSNMHWIFAKRRRSREFLCNGGDWISRTRGHTTSTKGLVRKGPLPMQMQRFLPQKQPCSSGGAVWVSHTVEVILTSFVVVWPSDPLAFSYQNHIKFCRWRPFPVSRWVSFRLFFYRFKGESSGKNPSNFMTF